VKFNGCVHINGVLGDEEAGPGAQQRRTLAG
jgi:hypothetical protein